MWLEFKCFLADKETEEKIFINMDEVSHIIEDDDNPVWTRLWDRRAEPGYWLVTQDYRVVKDRIKRG